MLKSASKMKWIQKKSWKAMMNQSWSVIIFEIANDWATTVFKGSSETEKIKQGRKIKGSFFSCYWDWVTYEGLISIELINFLNRMSAKDLRRLADAAIFVSSEGISLERSHGCTRPVEMFFQEARILEWRRRGKDEGSNNSLQDICKKLSWLTLHFLS